MEEVSQSDTPRTLTALEDRVRELEAALAAAKPAEDAVADRVMEKLLAAREAGAVRLPAEDGQLVVARPPQPPVGTSPRLPEAAPRRWLLFELLSEIRLLPQMYFDPRYRLSRMAQFAGPVFLVAAMMNYLFFNQLFLTIQVVTPVMETLVYMLLGVLFYKVMSRELTRYREVLEYLDTYGYR